MVNRYYVYLFILQGTDYYKIGYTNKLDKRLSTVNTSSPHTISCVSFYPFRTSRQASAFEGYLHRNFNDKRLRNDITGQLKEWFILNQEDVTQISTDYQEFIDYLNRPAKPVCDKLKEALHQATTPRILMPSMPATIVKQLPVVISSDLLNINKLTKRIL